MSSLPPNTKQDYIALNVLLTISWADQLSLNISIISCKLSLRVIYPSKELLESEILKVLAATASQPCDKINLNSQYHLVSILKYKRLNITHTLQKNKTKKKPKKQQWCENIRQEMKHICNSLYKILDSEKKKTSTFYTLS